MQPKAPSANASGVATRTSRISGLYRIPIEERLALLVDRGFLRPEEADALHGTGSLLRRETADAMIENVIGVFELPIGVGLNFTINERDYAIPMVVEEPSIVAAVSHAAALVRRSGGFRAEADASVMTGQIQVVGLADPAAAAERVQDESAALLERANALEPNMVKRGGGARALETRILDSTQTGGDPMLVVHLHFDVCDAMGANLINTVAEGLALEIERLTGGSVFLRILTNLTDRRCARASCSIPVAHLDWQGFAGAAVAEGIVQASRFAEADPYRAATHNKGIMNGIDAVALATGQDWRALEAGAHAYAARSGRYGPLATWTFEDKETLRGDIELPMAVGIVGGPIRLHPTVRILFDMLGVKSAGELGMVMAAVGLAQNLAAIKALGSTGIQKGHMALHARSVAATAGAVQGELEAVASQLIAEGAIRVDRAREVLASLRRPGTPSGE